MTRTETERITKRDESQSWLLFSLIAVITVVLIVTLAGFAYVIVSEQRDKKCLVVSLQNLFAIGSQDRHVSDALITREGLILAHPGPDASREIRDAIRIYTDQRKADDKLRAANPLRLKC